MADYINTSENRDDKPKHTVGDACETSDSQDWVNHPSHYGGGDNPYEVIKVIRAWDLGFDLGNAVKYIARAGKKNPEKTIEDLEKAVFYLQDEIRNLKASDNKPNIEIHVHQNFGGMSPSDRFQIPRGGFR